MLPNWPSLATVTSPVTRLSKGGILNLGISSSFPRLKPIVSFRKPLCNASPVPGLSLIHRTKPKFLDPQQQGPCRPPAFPASPCHLFHPHPVSCGFQHPLHTPTPLYPRSLRSPQEKTSPPATGLLSGWVFLPYCYPLVMGALLSQLCPLRSRCATHCPPTPTLGSLVAQSLPFLDS